MSAEDSSQFEVDLIWVHGHRNISGKETANELSKGWFHIELNRVSSLTLNQIYSTCTVKFFFEIFSSRIVGGAWRHVGL